MTKEICFKQYTTSIPITAYGKTSPRYWIISGVFFSPPIRRKGANRIIIVTSAETAINKIKWILSISSPLHEGLYNSIPFPIRLSAPLVSFRHKTSPSPSVCPSSFFAGFFGRISLPLCPPTISRLPKGYNLRVNSFLRKRIKIPVMSSIAGIRKLSLPNTSRQLTEPATPIIA